MARLVRAVDKRYSNIMRDVAQLLNDMDKRVEEILERQANWQRRQAKELSWSDKLKQALLLRRAAKSLRRTKTGDRL
jgi:hypothetical protein